MEPPPPVESGGPAALGALAPSLVFWLLQQSRKVAGETPTIAPLSLSLLALIGGLTGSFTDSLLGATFQAMYYCPSCQKETERSIHNCGTRTQPLRGLPWLNNDVVNFIATLCGAFTTMGLHVLTTRNTKHA